MPTDLLDAATQIAAGRLRARDALEASLAQADAPAAARAMARRSVAARSGSPAVM
mgnify:CR=1 FL=1